MTAEQGGPKPEIISHKDKEQPSPKSETKVKPWRRVAAGVALVGALAGMGLRAFAAGGGDTEVRPQTATTKSLETEQPPTLKDLIKETQTDLANKSVDLLKEHPKEVIEEDSGFTMNIISSPSATGEKTSYALHVDGAKKNGNGSYDPADITGVQFSIVNLKKGPESERPLYSVSSTENNIIFADSDFTENTFSAVTADTEKGIADLQKFRKQINPLFASASKKQQLPSVEKPE